jgi:hypothetical protein
MINEDKEMCIDKEEYILLMNKMDEFSKQQTEFGKQQEQNTKEISQLGEQVNGMDKKVSTTALFVSGNGEPEKGINFRLSFLERGFLEHIAFHKNVEGGVIDMLKPLGGKLLEWIVLGGIFYGISALTQ